MGAFQSRQSRQFLLYNNPGTFNPTGALSLIGPSDGFFGQPIQGNFELFLYDPNSSSDYRISQPGDIPNEVNHLSFQYRNSPFVASINGQDISPLFLPRATGLNPVTVVADISQFAGQSVELSFRPIPPLFGDGGRSFELDNIAFIIPEPSTYALLALGAGLLGGRQLWRHWHRRLSPDS